jgi:hypothetical protein
MRNTLIIGLLLCLPTVVLLASASLALLIGKLRRVPIRRLSGLPVVEPHHGRFRDDMSRPSSVLAGRLSGPIPLYAAGPRRSG